MPQSAKAMYARMETDRRPFLDRAERAAALTIPSLIPPSGFAQGQSLPDPHQSIGAQAVNSLAGKLLTALFSEESARIRPRVDVAAALDEDSELELEVSRGLANIEKLIQADSYRKGDRVAGFEALKQLIVAGNALLFDHPTSGLTLFQLYKYVIRRDGLGTPIHIIVREVFDRATVEPRVLELLDSTNTQDYSENPQESGEEVEVFTVVQLQDGRYQSWQEIGSGERIPGTESSWPRDRLPWHPLRLVRVAGEDYGRGRVEEYLGDLGSLEGLRKAIVEGSAAASKVLFLVRPNSSTRLKTIANSPNGAVATGDADDVQVVQLGKFADFRIAQETAAEIQRNIEGAFLMNQSARRNAERVTATEIRLVAEELESGLGGIYSLLTQEFQLPFVRQRLASLQSRGLINNLPPEAVEPVIVTGIEALSRDQEAARLGRYLSSVGALLGPEVALEYVDPRAVLERLGIAEGVDTTDLLLSREEIAQQQQQRQQQQFAMQATGPAIQAVGRVAENGIAPQIVDGIAGAQGLTPPQQ